MTPPLRRSGWSGLPRGRHCFAGSLPAVQFAAPLPAWALVLVIAAVLGLAWLSYRSRRMALPPRRRWSLTALRAAALLALVGCLLRPAVVLPPDGDRDAVVPLLVDVSRSMRLDAGDGQPRVARAAAIERRLASALERRFVVERWAFGDTLRPAGLSPEARDDRTDLAGALHSLRERYRDRRLAGVVVISDGADTGAADAAAALRAGGVPVHAIGVGSADAADLQITDVSPGESVLEDASVDLTVLAMSRGRRAPFDVRMLENGRPVDVRRVEPPADGSPARVTFTVAPSRETATVYTAVIDPAAGELAVENNRYSVVVDKPPRPRRVLMIEGAPGFEHSFMKRALEADAALQLDAVVRKGRDGAGRATYFVQAARDTGDALATGFPRDRDTLFSYEAIVLANVEADALSAVQLQWLAEFVDRRGGGLLLLGARSFAGGGLAGTPLEPVLPLALTGRAPDIVLASARGGEALRVALTPDGLTHPVMRLSAGDQAGAAQWDAMPALGGVSELGAPRPGAQVLAAVRTAGGERPLIAVQRFGRGRSMLFTGEGAWRWRMRLPSHDHSYERFWRQAVRWLAGAAPERVGVTALPSEAPAATTLAVDVHDAAFAPVSDARVSIEVAEPGSGRSTVPLPVTDAAAGRYAADVPTAEPGVYRVAANVTRGGLLLGHAERALLVGGVDREMADPRLHEPTLRRLARETGGTYAAADEALDVAEALAAAERPDQAQPRLRELWNTTPVFLAIAALLSAEWLLRRRWGLV